MRELRLGVVGVIVLSLAVGASGDVIELPLNCAGTYDINSPHWSTDFDLGVTFSEISHVYIDWSGEIKAGMVQYYHPLTFEPIGDPFPIDVGIYASLGSNPYSRRTTIWGGQESYPAPEAFATISEISLSYSSTWSDLLDGQGEVIIGYTIHTMLDAQYLEYGSVVVNDATLVFEGNIVPEPGTILLLGSGLVVVIRQNHLRRKQSKNNL